MSNTQCKCNIHVHVHVHVHVCNGDGWLLSQYFCDEGELCWGPVLLVLHDVYGSWNSISHSES